MSLHMHIYDIQKNITNFDVPFFVCYLACPLGLVTSNKLKGEEP